LVPASAAKAGSLDPGVLILVARVHQYHPDDVARESSRIEADVRAAQ